MNYIHSIFYGLISGLAEFFPVSSAAHQLLYTNLLNFQSGPLFALAIHTGMLFALLLRCRSRLGAIRRERRLARLARRRRRRDPDLRLLLDGQILKTAAVPMLLGMLFYEQACRVGSRLYILALFFILNGIVLFLPQLMPTGNKDSRSMVRLDGLLLGICAAVSVFPGLSRVGFVTAAGTCRGVDRPYITELALLLSVPALLCMLVLDGIAVATSGAISAIALTLMPELLLAAAAAAVGAYLSIGAMRFLAIRTGFGGFSYYCWGLAMFSFILFLTI